MTMPPERYTEGRISHYHRSGSELTYRLCDNVNMKAHVQAIRHLVYQVFDSLLALHRSTMKAMGSDFINSFTKMVDGEKDPRNLMLLFSLEKVILLEFDVQEHIEVSRPPSQRILLI
jgi:DNA repair/transcription protein MET18/MMS19